MTMDAVNQFSVYPLIALIGYLIGSSNMAFYLAKLKGVDLKTDGGTGNPGASNALILMGWKAGVLVGAHDIGKAVLAVWLAGVLFPNAACGGAAAGVACVLGHMFPFYTHFRGGKGFAAYLGMTLALNWKFALILLAAIVILLLVTDYIVMGTMTTVLAFPAYCAATHHVVTALILCVASAAMIWKHRDNLVRIADGTEIGFRSAGRGDHRIR